MDELTNKMCYTVTAFKTCCPENTASRYTEDLMLKEFEKMAEGRFFLTSSCPSPLKQVIRLSGKRCPPCTQSKESWTHWEGSGHTGFAKCAPVYPT